MLFLKSIYNIYVRINSNKLYKISVGIILLMFCLMSNNIFAADENLTNPDTINKGLGYIAAGIVTGLSTIGAGIATGSAAAAALGAVSENEKFMGKSLIFVALAEGIAVYGLLISFIIFGRIN
jgi:V/A-type H+-transporting ATPase subunit K